MQGFRQGSLIFQTDTLSFLFLINPRFCHGILAFISNVWKMLQSLYQHFPFCFFEQKLSLFRISSNSAPVSVTHLNVTFYIYNRAYVFFVSFDILNQYFFCSKKVKLNHAVQKKTDNRINEFCKIHKNAM